MTRRDCGLELRKSPESLCHAKDWIVRICWFNRRPNRSYYNRTEMTADSVQSLERAFASLNTSAKTKSAMAINDAPRKTGSTMIDRFVLQKVRQVYQQFVNGMLAPNAIYRETGPQPLDSIRVSRKEVFFRFLKTHPELTQYRDELAKMHPDLPVLPLAKMEWERIIGRENIAPSPPRRARAVFVSGCPRTNDFTDRVPSEPPSLPLPG